MKNILTILFAVCALSITHAQVGYLTTGDSTESFMAKQNEWVNFFLIDSTGSGDTCTLEKYNTWSATWSPLICRDDSSETYSSRIVMSVSNTGKSFTVWQAYPGTIRLRWQNRAAPTGKLYYYIFTTGR